TVIKCYMTEIQRTQQLFENLYNGNPWLEVTLVKTLENISAERAAEKKYTARNSIWEITNHLINWRLNVLQRVTGHVIVTPEHNYILPIEDTSEAAWRQTLENLEDSQQQWCDFLSKFNQNDFEEIYPPNGHTHYEHIHGIIQHDAYHLGQIVLLANHPDA
ncbi:MAG TPA: DinB family protein, partial [Flavobacterium sp.]|nr:DinB family protein [Flavobacterium sp.]